MKNKKIVAVVLTAIMVLTLAACGSEKPAPIAPETTAVDLNNVQTQESSTQTEATDNRSVASEGREIEGTIFRSPYSNTFAVVDRTGKVLETYDKEKLAADYDVNGYIEEGQPMAYYKGNIIFVSYEYYGEDNYVVVSSYDTKTKKVQLITKLNDVYLEAVDAYDGLLYIDYSVFDIGRSYHEVIYAFNEEEGSFDGVECPLQIILDDFKPSYIVFNTLYANASYGMYECLTRTMDDCGYIMASFDGEYMMLNNKSMRQPLGADGVYAMYYTGGFVYYNESYESGSALCVYDIAKQESFCITDYYGMVKGVSGGRIYYATNFSNQYGIEDYHYFMYDPWMRNVIEICNVEEDPESGYEYDPNGLFMVVNDIVFFAKAENGRGEWMRAIPAAGGRYNVEATGIIDATYGYEDIDINYLSQSWYCDYCYNAIGHYYGEYPVFDRNVYAYADEINEFFLELAMVDKEYFSNDEYLTPEDDSMCDDHMEFWGTVTYDRELTSIKTIWDHYLEVNYGNYYYSGGAHGMPSEEQYLFDLNTGKRVLFTDIYNGTEEDFRTIVAENTRRDYEMYDYEYSPYFAVDADQAYEEAYEYSALSDYDVRFGEDCLYYVFTPYSMGPFASGFIYIEIPYDEVGLKGYFGNN